MPKAVIENLTDVPEALRGEYEQRDGKYHLKIEGELPGFAPVTKLQEFRDNNIKLIKEKEQTVKELEELRSLKTRFDGVDPDEYKLLKEKHSKLEKKGIKDDDDVDKVFAEKIEKALAPVKKELESQKILAQEAQKKADKAKMREVIGGALVKAGARQDALDYLLVKADDFFLADNGEIKAKEGKTSPKDGVSPITAEEWIQSAVKEHSFAFEKSQGGGATPSAGGARPGVKTLLNPTPQQLGENAAAIAKGELQVVHTT